MHISLVFLQMLISYIQEEVKKVLEILSTYEAASGQKLNMGKSEVSFSRNIDQEKKNLL